jgi:murein DD-endopeptidase MepM/ murein hydrolase activator NlpD
MPRHRARATIRARRIRHSAALLAIGAVWMAWNFGLGTAPRPVLVAASPVIPQFAPTPLNPLLASLVSSPPITMKSEFGDDAPPAPPTGLPLPAQYVRGGSIDQGVDYLAPGGTPLLAMGPGVIIQEGGPGTSGFGPNIPVLQITGGPLAGKTVYYGHAGPDLVPVGTVVTEGQQIGIVGFGRVGLSSAPHLEIGFWPLGGMRAGADMMAYINQVMGHSTAR